MACLPSGSTDIITSPSCYVTQPPGTPISSPILLMYVGDPYIVYSPFLIYLFVIIRESVDSLCRDDADMPMPPYIGKACNRPNAAFVSLFR